MRVAEVCARIEALVRAQRDPEIGVEQVFARIEALGRAQCEPEQILACLRCELQLEPEDLSAFFEHEGIRAWVAACGLAGQGALQERMWQVASELVDQPVGSRMAQWLAVNFLGHGKSDVIVEIRRIVAELKADPGALVQLLARALELAGGETGGELG